LKQFLLLLALSFHEKNPTKRLLSGGSTLSYQLPRLRVLEKGNFVFCNKKLLIMHCSSTDLKNTLKWQFIRSQVTYKSNIYWY